MTKVKLTLAQAEQVEWALGAMADFWCSEEGAEGRDGPVYPEADLPRIEPVVGAAGKPHKASVYVVLSAVAEINDDLLYRLTDQLSQMERQAAGQWEEGNGAAKAGRNAAARIRHAVRPNG